MYRGGRRGSLARVMNRMSEMQFSAGLFSPKRAMTLEVPGRRTGRVTSFGSSPDRVDLAVSLPGVRGVGQLGS